MKNYEEVRCDYQHVKLIAPHGKIERTAYIDRESCPIDWAKKIILDLNNELCGNGKPLSNYPELFNGIYGKGYFTVLTDY